jgi:hypothetical protein
VFVPDVPVPVEPEVLVPEDDVPDEPVGDVPAGDVPDGAVLQLVQQPCSWLALPLLPMAPLDVVPVAELPLMVVPSFLSFMLVELHAARPRAIRPPMSMP